MKSISFKNFRRFADFPKLEFGDITILVGGNNAGKSTLLKAFILLVDNLRELKMRNENVFNAFWPTFSFDMDHIHQLNLGTYSRAHKLGAREGITFEAEIAHFKITFTIAATQEEFDSPAATIVGITILDKKRNIEFWFSPNEMGIDFKELSKNAPEHRNIMAEYEKQFDELLLRQKDALKTGDITEIASLNEEIAKVQRIMEQLNLSIPAKLGGTGTGRVFAPASNYVDGIALDDLTIPSNPLARFLYNWVGYQTLKPALAEWVPVDLDDPKVKEVMEKPMADWLAEGSDPYSDVRDSMEDGSFNKEDHETNHAFLEDKISTIREVAQELNKALYHLNEFDEVFYIQAHAITQRVLYSIDNRNDYMGQVLHRFIRENIQKGTEPDRFLKKWLKAFGIGVDYRVKSIEGEGYTLEISTSENQWQHLADLGMGSNQLVTLLMELATLLKTKGNRQYPIIIIEEPEQNLHPKVQSLLASLFSELNKERGFKFLIETHSEYFIRHTQVLVAEMGLSEEELEKQNPFKVYYFPEEGTPYDMKYLTNGHFEESFGEGFFDEAGKWTRELIRSKRR